MTMKVNACADTFD